MESVVVTFVNMKVLQSATTEAHQHGIIHNVENRPQRTSERQAEYAARAAVLSEAVQGVKGISIIDVLPTFDTVKRLHT